MGDVTGAKRVQVESRDPSLESLSQEGKSGRISAGRNWKRAPGLRSKIRKNAEKRKSKVLAHLSGHMERLGSGGR